MKKPRLAILSHLPEHNSFTLRKAAAHFKGQTFRRRPAVAGFTTNPPGFRVRTSAGSIVAWLETGEQVRLDIEELLPLGGFPVPVVEVAACTARLSVWGDAGVPPVAMHWFASELTERFGAFHYDHFAQLWLPLEASVADYSNLGSAATTDSF